MCITQLVGKWLLAVVRWSQKRCCTKSFIVISNCTHMKDANFSPNTCQQLAVTVTGRVTGTGSQSVAGLSPNLWRQSHFNGIDFYADSKPQKCYSGKKMNVASRMKTTQTWFLPRLRSITFVFISCSICFFYCLFSLKPCHKPQSSRNVFLFWPESMLVRPQRWIHL